MSRIDFIGIPLVWKQGVKQSYIDDSLDLWNGAPEPVVEVVFRADASPSGVCRRTPVHSKVALQDVSKQVSFLQDAALLPSVPWETDAHTLLYCGEPTTGADGLSLWW